MAAVLPARQGILLNPSPTGSPYSHPSSLPSTPHLISSYSSLSSSNAESDNYILSSPSEASSPLHRASLPPPSPLHQLGSHKLRSSSSPAASNTLASRRIRFAPFPDPRREVLVTEEGNELPLPPVFIDEADEDNLQASHPHIHSLRDGLVASVHVAAAHAADSSANPPSSLLFSNTPNGIALVEALPSGAAEPCVTSPIAETDWDIVSPQATEQPSALSSSTSTSPPQSSDDLDAGKAEKKSWASRIRPFFGRNGSKDSLVEDNYEGSALGLVRSESRGSTKRGGKKKKDEGALQRTDSNTTINRPSAAPSSTPASIYPPTHKLPTPRPANPNPNSKPRTLFSSPTATSLSMSLFSRAPQPSTQFGRTQSLTSDLRRVQSGGSVKSTKSLNSALNAKKKQQTHQPQQTQGVRRGQLKMLNGRVYGARRLDPFANVRSEDPEFVEWGYGGMGSVHNHLHSSEGNIWAKVQAGSGMSIGAVDTASWGTGSGESSTSGRSVSTRGDDDDDGSGMSWVKRRREIREREKQQQQVARKENETEMSTTPTNPVFAHTNPVSLANSAMATPTLPHHNPSSTSTSPTATELEHITTAVTLPPARPHYHHNRNMSTGTIQPTSAPTSGATTPSHVNHIMHAPERRDSADTAKGVPVTSSEHEAAKSAFVSEPEGMVGTMSPEESTSPSGSEETSPTGSGEEDEGEGGGESEDEDDEEDMARPTALGAGVEKISRHKDHLNVGSPELEVEG
ncbi:hypothetical protein EUX98_g2635 [Antrodiella citrinella]|uniref:Uncharacterized protein n=1 Tax=Antrodiella citrinella TaxID=2447956 RepID=A0A4V3XJ38_9APHY|nr:hypothetical protein EUX98_g2635 [Antrodiella citrinella]